MRTLSSVALPVGVIQAKRAIARGSKSFAFASLFFQRQQAQAAHAVYWFCRYTDDLVDEAPSRDQARRDLGEWTCAVRASLERRASLYGGPLDHFSATVAKFGIPHGYVYEFLDGMRGDLDRTRYPTFAELRAFCYSAASVVGLMMMHVIGFEAGREGQAAAHAIDLGIAMQLTNILRDLREDWNRGRVYLPQDEMEASGYDVNRLSRGVRDDVFRKLMSAQIARARRCYESAEPGIAMLSGGGQTAVRVAARVYCAILKRIEKADYDVFSRRIFVPAHEKAAIAAACLLGGDHRR